MAKILVVDDNPAVCSAIELLFELGARPRQGASILPPLHCAPARVSSPVSYPRSTRAKILALLCHGPGGRGGTARVSKRTRAPRVSKGTLCATVRERQEARPGKAVPRRPREDQ